MCRQCLGARDVPPPFVLLTLLPLLIHLFALSIASRISDSYPRARQFGGVSLNASSGLLRQIRTKASDRNHAFKRALTASSVACVSPAAVVECVTESDVAFPRSFMFIEDWSGGD